MLLFVTLEKDMETYFGFLAFGVLLAVVLNKYGSPQKESGFYEWARDTADDMDSML